MSWSGVIIIVVGAAIALVSAGLSYMINMPGSTRGGALPSLDEAEREFVPRLRRHVEMLAGDIGGRSLENPGSLERAAAYIERELTSYGYTPARQTYQAAGTEFHNIEARGAVGTVVVGAHYDTA
ncbi:MAG TPA: hypothetical protein VEQ63_06155, partial [Bryobacteraceae bacterium]|nr:hypothetical protein [Bryobacteraceae bacterium]